MTRPRFMATGGEWPAGLALLRGVRAAGYDSVAALTRPDALSRYSRAPVAKVLVPEPADAEGHAAAVARAADACGAAAVLPGTDASLLALAQYRHAFSDPTVVAVPALEVVRRAMDKVGLAALAARAGLGTPPSYPISRADGFDGPFPAIVKPFSSVETDAFGRQQHVGVMRARDQDELAQVLGTMPGEQALVQPFIQARLRTVNGVAWAGRLVCCVHKRSDRTWPTDAGSFAYGRTVAAEPALEAGSARLLGEIGWSGLFNLQFLETESGEHLLIDLNPRAYHSMALAIGAGANLPAVWCDLLLGRRPRPVQPRVGVHFRAEEDDLHALHAAAHSRSVGKVVSLLRPRRRTVHALFQARDPGPFVHLVKTASSHKRL